MRLSTDMELVDALFAHDRTVLLDYIAWFAALQTNRNNQALFRRQPWEGMATTKWGN